MVGIELKPLGQAFFRPPAGVTQAGVHGPSSMVKSLSYPMPSTISGALAGIAYRSGLCSLDNSIDVDVYEDHYACLKELLGEQFSLRPGLVRARGRIYAYTGSQRLPPIECLTAPSQATCRDEELTLPHAGYIGIALSRHSKAVAEGHLYHSEAVDYPATEASILVLVQAKAVDIREDIIMLGAETRPALLSIDNSVDIKLLMGGGPEGSDKWEATLLTPALLGKAPEADCMVITATSSLASMLSRLLQEESQNSISNCISTLEVIEVPRGELQAEILNAGWSMRAKTLRRPYLILPPGTRIRLEAPPECIDRVVEAGLGAHSRLGWGTIAVKPLED